MELTRRGFIGFLAALPFAAWFKPSDALERGTLQSTVFVADEIHTSRGLSFAVGDGLDFGGAIRRADGLNWPPKYLHVNKDGALCASYLCDIPADSHVYAKIDGCPHSTEYGYA